MAQFTMTIPNGLIDGILDAFEYSYPIPVDEEEVPIMSPAQNARKQLRRYIREIYIAYRANEDAETARLAAIEDAETDSEPIEVN